MTDLALARSTAIVGIGSSDFGGLYHSTSAPSLDDLAIEAMDRAIADAGLTTFDVDGLVVSGIPGVGYESIMLRTGLQNARFLAHYPLGGRLCPMALGHAAMAVHHGLADCVVAFNAVNFRTRGQRFGGDSSASSGVPPVASVRTMYQEAYGMTSPGAQYALLYSRYAERYQTTESDLAEIPMAIRSWASLNPEATFREPMSLDNYLAGPYVVRPLRRFDYCLVNDGAVAYVVTSADRARDLRHPPVFIEGVASRAAIRPYYVNEDYWFAACRSLKRDLLDELGVGLSDIDSLQIYDNYSPVIAWALEGLGYVPVGEGLRWIAGGRIGPGGELPINTSGGMLSEAYLQGWNLLVEAVRQLRGDAGPRQIPDCRRILYVGLSALPGAGLLSR